MNPWKRPSPPLHFLFAGIDAARRCVHVQHYLNVGRVALPRDRAEAEMAALEKLAVGDCGRAGAHPTLAGRGSE